MDRSKQPAPGSLASAMMETMEGPLEMQGPPEPEEIKFARLNKEWESLHRIMVELIYQQSDIEHISREKFFVAFEKLLSRLEISADQEPMSILWRLAAASLATQPEFKRPNHRPKTNRAGMSYERHVAVVRYKAQNGTSIKDIEAIRALISCNHRLFAGYSEETLKKEVSRGKNIAKKLRRVALAGSVSV